MSVAASHCAVGSTWAYVFMVKFAALRAGIEGTLARGIRRCRLRRTRYRGQPKVHLGHILTATGPNFLRLGEWFADVPRRRSRRSPSARLLAAPLAV